MKMQHSHTVPGMEHGNTGPAMKGGHYRGLIVMAFVSFAVMYALMYAMVDALGSVYMSINQVYMAGLMAAPMVAIELLVMRGMYDDRRMNTALIVGSLALAAVFWMLIRTQGGVGDRQFLRSMIPHHSGAILMCGKAKLTDPRIKNLCAGIMEGQRREINEMKALLAEKR